MYASKGMRQRLKGLPGLLKIQANDAKQRRGAKDVQDRAILRVADNVAEAAGRDIAVGFIEFGVVGATDWAIGCQLDGKALRWHNYSLTA